MEKLASSQTDLVALLAENHELIDENRRLREKLQKTERFERYRLEQTPMGDFILQLKDKHVTDEEPTHAICTYCREEGKLSYLSEGSHRYRCRTCLRSAWIKPVERRPRSRTVRSGI